MQPIPLLEKAGAGLAAGGLAAIVGSPADLSLIRMQSDSTLPAASRRNYKHVGDAMTRCEPTEAALFFGAPHSLPPSSEHPHLSALCPKP